MTRAPDSQALPLYRRILGANFKRLPPEIRALHDLRSTATAVGRCAVVRGRHPISRLAGWLFAMPPEASDLPVRVRFEPSADGEVWRRRFGEHGLESVQEAGPRPGLLIERFGAGSFLVAVSVEASGLRLDLQGVRLFGLPLPRFFWPKVRARESVEDGRFAFDVEIRLPLAGLLVHYRGTLRPQDSASREIERLVVNPA